MVTFADKYPPRCQVSSKPRNNVEEGTTVRLRCKVTGSPHPTISWIKEDKPLPQENKRISIRNNTNASALKIKNVKLADQGNYTCIAENALGKANATLQLEILRVRDGKKTE